MNNLISDAQWFNKRLTTKGFASLTNTLLSSLSLSQKKHQGTLRAFLANLYSAHNNNNWAIIRLSNNEYTASQYYNMPHMTYRKVRKVFDALRLAGLIDVKMGIRFKHASFCTRIKATPALVRLFTEHVHLEEINIPDVRFRSDHKGHIKGALISPSMSQAKDLDTITQDLDRINSVNASITIPREILEAYIDISSPFMTSIHFDVSLNSHKNRYVSALLKEQDTDLITIDLQYHRVFNGRTTTRGGRFYSDATNLPKSIRPYAKLNGKPIVELDYSAMHPRLLYAEEGLTPDIDPYDIEGIKRKDAKLLFLIAINSKDKKQAINAIRKAQNERRDGDRIENQEDPKELLKRLESAHSPIQKHFYTSAWAKLMKTESTIANLIMKDFADKGRPIFALHDGFVVREEDEDLLYHLMFMHYDMTVNQEPIIKREEQKQWKTTPASVATDIQRPQTIKTRMETALSARGRASATGSPMMMKKPRTRPEPLGPAPPHYASG